MDQKQPGDPAVEKHVGGMRPAREVPPAEDVVPRGKQEENGEEDEGEVARADGDVV